MCLRAIISCGTLRRKIELRMCCHGKRRIHWGTTKWDGLLSSRMQLDAVYGCSQKVTFRVVGGMVTAEPKPRVLPVTNTA